MLWATALLIPVSPIVRSEFAFAIEEAEYPKSISIEQAAEKKESGALFLDVREATEWLEAHIPGSVLIPLGQLKNRLNELPADKDIVVVCRSGSRSVMGLDILRMAGFNQSSGMAGGLIAWKAKGYPTATGSQNAAEGER
jgi:rhodanese-related sulfurtransferase